MSCDRLFAGAVLAASLLAIPPAIAQTAPPLGSYNVDLSQTSVSGLSSGAFMAVQYHVAHSASVMGVGVIAGGPDFCAEGNSLIAVSCMKIMPSAAQLTASNLFKQAKDLASAKQVDPVTGLASAKVYLFSGKNDQVVSTGTVNAVQDLYALAGVKNIEYENSIDAGHAFISPQAINACNFNGAPYVNKCEVNGTTAYDQPYHVLTAIYGTLTPPSVTTGQAVPFDQTAFGATSAAMAATGFVYVPSACQGNTPATCRVHVVFHGCLQSAENPGVGDIVYNQVGYNRWAETNHIIVLYPQVAANIFTNPQTCWDWFGYTNVYFDQPTHYATTDAPQIRAVTAMIQRLGGH